MTRILLLVFVLSVFFVDYVFSNNDSVVFQDGDVRINGLGNGLAFPDGTMQYSAAPAVPLHGTIGGITGGTLQTGKGFTSIRTSTGFYTVSFTNPFSTAPDCFVSAQGNVSGGNGHVVCELSDLANQSAINVNCLQYPPPGVIGQNSAEPINSLFSFICVP